MPFNDNLPAENTDPWYTPLVTAWNNLKTFVNGLETTLGTKADQSALTTGLASKVNTSTYTSGMASKADLVGGVIPTSQLPAIAVTEFLGNVADQAAMLALDGQKGDWAIRTDTSSTWVITGDDPSVIGDWTELETPSGGGGAVNSVNGQTGTVVLGAADVGAAATVHTHTIAQVTNLQASLDAKADSADLGTAAAQDSTAFATSAQGAKADSAVQPAAIANLVPNTRTVAGKPLSADVTLAKGDVGLGNVDNTSDANKPVSTAQQTALNLKAPVNNPTFTGTVGGITKAMVGLGNVDNTSDANKPVSTAQAAAINAKVGSANSSVSGIEYYPTPGDLPPTGVAGVIYVVDVA